MKRVLIIAVIAFCSLSFAQLNETTTQVGTGNNALINQSGAGLSTSTVNQTGDLNFANVMTNGSVLNDITQLQNSNFALQSITGLNTAVSIKQDGNSNFGQQSNSNGTDASSSLKLEQIGDANISYQIIQSDSKKDISEVSQEGNNNGAYILQTGMSSTYDGNKAIIDQDGNLNMVGSSGSFFSQMGYLNNLEVHQTGLANTLVGYQNGISQIKYVSQNGNSNYGIINENGPSGWNGGYLIQNGDNNYADQYQYGVAMCGYTNQSGNYNQAYLDQFGSNNYSASMQWGTSNVANVYQSGNNNYSLTWQNGTSNNAVINQH